MANNAQATLVTKSGGLDLEFGWEPTPTTTLATTVPRQTGRKAGIGKAAWQGTNADVLRAALH
jgi:hypothetical protein